MCQVAPTQPSDCQVGDRATDAPFGANPVAANRVAKPAVQQVLFPLGVPFAVQPIPGKVVVSIAHADAFEVDEECAVFVRDDNVGFLEIPVHHDVGPAVRPAHCFAEEALQIAPAHFANHEQHGVIHVPDAV